MFSFGGSSSSATSTAPTSTLSFGAKPASSGFSFGTSTNPTTSTSTGFAFSGFGATPASTSTASTLFPTTTSGPTAFTGFNLGLGTNTSSATTTTSSGFTGFGGLGGTTFGSGMGTTTAAKPAALLTTGTTGILNADQVNVLQATFVHPLLFGDDRDIVLSRWNQLQALWGTGTGYSSKGVIQYTPYNPFCKLKAVVYNAIPSTTDADGIVSICIQRPPSGVAKQRQAVQDTLFRILGSKSNLHVNVDEIRPANADSTATEIVFYVIEKSPTGLERRVPTSELVAFLNGNATARSQLQTQLQAIPHPSSATTIPSAPTATTTTSTTGTGGFGTFSFSNPTTAGGGFGGFGSLSSSAASQQPLVRGHLAPSSRELQQYLDATGVLLGYSPSQWQEIRQRDNPDPSRFIPVPVIGMSELKHRMENQAQFAKCQLDTLKRESQIIQELKTKCSNMTARVDELKRKQAELDQRVLKVFCGLEVYRKQGLSLSSEEEQLRVHLERLWSELMTHHSSVSSRSLTYPQAVTLSTAPGVGGPRVGGLKARVQECASLCRSLGPDALNASKENDRGENYVLDTITQAQLQSHMDKQNQCIQEMLGIIQEDMEVLQIIAGGGDTSNRTANSRIP